MLVLVKMKVPPLDPLVTQHAVSRSELGHDQPASAQALDEAAEDRVSDAGHRRKHCGGTNLHVADL